MIKVIIGDAYISGTKFKENAPKTEIHLIYNVSLKQYEYTLYEDSVAIFSGRLDSSPQVYYKKNSKEYLELVNKAIMDYLG